MARFANTTTGGLVLIGFGTAKSGSVETISKMVPMPRETVDADQYRKTIDDNLVPRVHGLTVEWLDRGDNSEVGRTFAFQTSRTCPGDLGHRPSAARSSRTGHGVGGNGLGRQERYRKVIKESLTSHARHQLPCGDRISGLSALNIEDVADAE
ncbi:hypothetical protein ABZV61_39025 [Streptomyces sp900116325]|uniref:Schlafen AlbA-2 domain-containing protein n=1 Tax=Streptomyces sp. 900116325 TaxID=3154295 RepID=A0ABV2UL84_9ACTN